MSTRRGEVTLPSQREALPPRGSCEARRMRKKLKLTLSAAMLVAIIVSAAGNGQVTPPARITVATSAAR